MVERQVAQHAGDGHLPAPVFGLRVDLFALLAIPARLDMDHSCCEVDVLPAQRLEFAEPEPRVQRGPLAPVAELERGEQPPRVFEARNADAVTARRTFGTGTPLVRLTARSPRSTARL